MPSDWPAINAFLAEEDVEFIPQPILDIGHPFTSDMSVEKEKEFSQMYITQKTFDSHICFKYLENQKYYMVDDLRSKVIQFDRGGIHSRTPDVLDRGRLYFATSYYDEVGNIVEREDDFIAWAARIFKKFRRFLVKSDVKGIYLSESVAKLMSDTAAEMHRSATYIKLSS